MESSEENAMSLLQPVRRAIMRNLMGKLCMKVLRSADSLYTRTEHDQMKKMGGRKMLVAVQSNSSKLI